LRLIRHVRVGCLFKLWKLSRIVVDDARGAMLSSRESRVCVIISYESGDSTKVIKNQDDHEMRVGWGVLRVGKHT
jgi:hypothetical protein